MTVSFSYLINLSDHWTDAALVFKLKLPQNRSKFSLNKHISLYKTSLDNLTMVQLQTEDFSLLEIKLPQHFPGSYSQHSLIKAITQSREKHFVLHIESNSSWCIVLE